MAFNFCSPWVHGALSAPGGINPEGGWPRMAAMYDASEAIPEVPTEWFQTNMLPPLPPALAQDNLDSVIQQLVRRGTLTKSGTWASFSVESQQQHGPGFQAATRFMGMVSGIGKAAQAVLPNLDQHVEFMSKPNITLLSKHRRDASRPDTFGVYTGHRCASRNTKRPGWEVLVVPGEFKEVNSMYARDDNVRKILWSFRHIMREDVRRRFVVGYTIENSFMRLWFCSSADLLVTEEFDFMTEPRIVTHFFLSQMYASESQLGYDTTIRYPADVSLHGKQWDIDVRVWVPRHAVLSKNTKGKGKEKGLYDEAKYGDDGKARGKGEKQGCWVTHTYRTSKVLSNVGAEPLRGKGTRVWEASMLYRSMTADGGLISYVPHPRKVVLKDSWTDSDQDREAVIMHQIVDSAPDEERDTLKKHFLTVMCYGDVFLRSADMVTPDTTSQMRGGQVVPTDCFFYLSMETSFNAQTDVRRPNGAPANSGEPKNPHNVTLYAKSHHRIVFGEVGAAIDTLNSVRNILHMLAQATVALQSIHACGWIHRDISPGNILIVDGIAKITDLEYAKRMNDKSRHTRRIGTANYMALEADDHEYLFLPDPTATLENDAKKKADVAALYAAVESDQPEPKIAVAATVPAAQLQPPFYHNPIHDIESIWWLAVRLLLWRLIAPQYLLAQDVKWTLEKSKQQINHYAAFFKNRDTRRNVYVKRKFSQGANLVHPQLASIAGHLESVRVNLKAAYTTAEEDVAAIDHTTGSAITTVLLEHLLTARHAFVKTDFLFEPIDIRARKDTPEEPAALPPPTSADSRLEVRKRLRDEPTVQTLPSDFEEFDGSSRELICDAKRMKLSNTEVGSPVVGPSTIPRAALTKVEAPYSEEVMSGYVVSGKRKGKATEKGDEMAPARKRTRTRATPAGPLRRSTRLRKTTRP